MPDFSYDAMGGPATTSAAHGSFEDEAPLLEGARCAPVHLPLTPFHVRKGAELHCSAVPRCPAWLHACSSEVQPPRACMRTGWLSHAPAAACCADFLSMRCFACAAAELGIDLQGILQRSLAVLSYRLRSPTLQELDMGGPLLFAAILGSVHLLVWHLPLTTATLWCAHLDTPRQPEADSMQPCADGQAALWRHPRLVGGGQCGGVVRHQQSGRRALFPACACRAQQNPLLMPIAPQTLPGVHCHHQRHFRTAVRGLWAGPGHHSGPDQAGPSIYDCCCLLGYCLLPMLAHALASLLIPKCATSPFLAHCPVLCQDDAFSLVAHRALCMRMLCSRARQPGC